MELFVTLEDMNGSSKGSAPHPPSFGMDVSTRGSNPNPIACPTSLAAASLNFTLYSPWQNENVGCGNTKDMEDGRSLR